MNNVKPITVDEYLLLLRAKKSGVVLDLATMPGPRELYAAFSAQLERDDVDRAQRPPCPGLQEDRG